MAAGMEILKITFVIIVFSVCCALFPAKQAQAREEGLPPHLIQSVSSQEIYEGLLALDLLRCPVLAEPDPDAAYENVKGSVLRLQMGEAYGSGVIWRLTAEAAIIATNRHVLQYWDEADGLVCFPGGYAVDAAVLGLSADCDVGFLRVENGEIGWEGLKDLRSVAAETAPARTLFGEAQAASSSGEERGLAGFLVGVGQQGREREFHEALLQEERYIPLFQGRMLYGQGFAKEGMSGGGIFDGRGRLIGLLAGGTDRGEIAGVPAADVEAAYRDIVEKEEVEQ